jgi:signal transduction histidine kinase
MKQERPAKKLSVRDVEELAQLNVAMEQRLAACTAELAVVKRQLDTLILALSHGLRAPLRAINGFSQILLQDHRAGLSKQLQDYLKTIQGEASQAVTVIEDLLASAKQNAESLDQSQGK